MERIISTKVIETRRSDGSVETVTTRFETGSGSILEKIVETKTPKPDGSIQVITKTEQYALESQGAPPQPDVSTAAASNAAPVPNHEAPAKFFATSSPTAATAPPQFVQVCAIAGSGCCRLCGNSAVGKTKCSHCSCKFCPSCCGHAIVPGGCVGCQNVLETPELTIAAKRWKGACISCKQPSNNKRACLNCTLKFCHACEGDNIRRSDCTVCHQLAAESEPHPFHDVLCNATMCANCGKSEGGEKLRCVVCGKRYCETCESIGLGDKPEGIKCIACVGEKPHQLMIAKTSVDYAIKMRTAFESVAVNGKTLDDVQGWVLFCEGAFVSDGPWWYDQRCGWIGRKGEGPKFGIREGLRIGGKELDPECSGGDTGVFINGRHIKMSEKVAYQAASISLSQGNWFLDQNGDYGPEFGPYAGQAIGNFTEKMKKAKRNAAIGAGVLALGVGLVAGGDLLFAGGDAACAGGDFIAGGDAAGVGGDNFWHSDATGASGNVDSSGAGYISCGDGTTVSFGM